MFVYFVENRSSHSICVRVFEVICDKKVTVSISCAHFNRYAEYGTEIKRHYVHFRRTGNTTGLETKSI